MRIAELVAIPGFEARTTCLSDKSSTIELNGLVSSSSLVSLRAPDEGIEPPMLVDSMRLLPVRAASAVVGYV